MPRVVVKNDAEAELAEASSACPVAAFRKNGSSYVISPDDCIDCGVCQSMVSDGVIMEDGESPEDAVNFNREKAAEWEQA